MTDLGDFRKFLQIYGLDPASFLPDEAGDTLATAQVDGLLTTSRNLSGFVGGNDSADVFAFTLDTPSQLVVDLEDVDANAQKQPGCRSFFPGYKSVGIISKVFISFPEEYPQ